jgi:hypothetical protein
MYKGNIRMSNNMSVVFTTEIYIYIYIYTQSTMNDTQHGKSRNVDEIEREEKGRQVEGQRKALTD